MLIVLLIAFGIFGSVIKKLRRNHIDFDPLPRNEEIQEENPIIRNDVPNFEDNSNTERVVSKLGSMSRL